MPFAHHIYFIALLFTLFALSYIILLIFTPCAYNHSVELGTQDKEVVLQVA
jgi:hypothetical protein